jgi:hypothetical protein
MSGITFLITTYHRKESCQRLVNALQGLGNIVVVKDGQGYFIRGCDVYNTQEHLGKTGYWRTINRLFSLRIPAKYYIVLPDDFLISKDQIQQAIDTWNSIEDDKKICLNLYADRIGKPCWTRVVPTDCGNVYRTQWVDMCFLCEESFFTALGIIPPIVLDWVHKPLRSSGVGRYIGLYLHSHCYSLYQVKTSLVETQPEHGNSQMKGQI